MNGKMLKTVALITMIIDHFAAGIVYAMAIAAKRGFISKYPDRLTAMLSDIANQIGYDNLRTIYYLMRHIGRIAFPIYIFLLVEGFIYTKNIKKYLYSMGVFALLSEAPFDLALFEGIIPNWEGQNVFVTMFLGLLCLTGIKYIMEHFRYDDVLRYFLMVGVTLLLSSAAFFIRCDYKWGGVLTIAVVYLVRVADHKEENLRLTWIMMFLVACGILTIYSHNEWYSFFALPLIVFYNGKRGNIVHKYIYYAMYPIHLMIIGFLMKITGLMDMY